MRQSNAARAYKLGYTAKDFDILDWVSLFGYTANPIDQYVIETGLPGVAYVSGSGGTFFAANVDAPTHTGMLSPQVVVLPAKSTVNVKVSIIWDDLTGVGEKVGWLLYVQHNLVGDLLYGTLPEGFVQSSTSLEDVDYTTNITFPTLNPLWVFPRTQYSIGYGIADQTIKSTPMYMLRYGSPSTLKLDDTYAMRHMSEYIDDTYVLLTMYLYRMAGTTATNPAFLKDGLYDADGCGAADTDNFAGSARFLGILMEFD